MSVFKSGAGLCCATALAVAAQGAEPARAQTPRFETIVTSASLKTISPNIPSLDKRHPHFTPDYSKIASIHTGYERLCRVYGSNYCALQKDGTAELIDFTLDNLEQINRINFFINKTVKPAEDKEAYFVSEHWTYPDGRGDCEDYALEKRRHLIAAGFPATALPITIVTTADGEGHAVLTVRTSNGTFVLDNLNDKIKPFTDTGFYYHAMLNPRPPADEKSAHFDHWLDIGFINPWIQQYLNKKAAGWIPTAPQ